MEGISDLIERRLHCKCTACNPKHWKRNIIRELEDAHFDSIGDMSDYLSAKVRDEEEVLRLKRKYKISHIGHGDEMTADQKKHLLSTWGPGIKEMTDYATKLLKKKEGIS